MGNAKYKVLPAISFVLLSACGSPTVSPEPTLDVTAIYANAFEEAVLHYTQTAAAMPTLTFTQTLTETLTPIPANTNTPLPTWTPRPTITNTFVFIPPTADQSDCHPSYIGACIPYPPPDLDCSDLSSRNIIIVGPDVHRLDGRDNDGVGCEE